MKALPSIGLAAVIAVVLVSLVRHLVPFSKDQEKTGHVVFT